jgi:outer membrane receptor protein involved in Fe transport
VGALYHVNDQVSVWGSLGWGFRAPTLNELYRQFRVGAELTMANNQLGPERLVSGESGVNLTPNRNISWRSSVFVNRFTNAVSNLTIGTNLLQRRNLERTRIWGIQSDVDYRLLTYWRVSAGYLYGIARVKESTVDPTLVNKFLAQVPRHRGSVELNYTNPRYLNASVQAQVVGGQYDNDVNNRWLPYFAAVDISASRRIAYGMDVFFGVQNLLDRKYYVQRNPTTVGAPRLVTAGVEYTWNGR